jgi:bifunctional non-homologous end joining protein LigD
VNEPILPQRPIDERVEVDSVEWLFEPDWPGERIVALVADDEVRLTGADGQSLPDHHAAVRVLARAVRASRAVIDGVWTAQPFLDAPDEPDDGGERAAFVAIDLLELDGASLLDVPFQERRRLLESVMDEDIGVRVSPMVKQPIGGWLAGWRENGFTHYLARHQNSRYRPGERSDDWLRIAIESARPPGLLQRVVGGGGARTRRVRG